MGWIETIRSLTRTKPPETGETGQGARTWAKGGGTQNILNRFFGKRNRDKGHLEKYRHIYEQGGVVSQAIDAYAMYTLMNGYRLEGDEAQFENVEQFLDDINFLDIARLAVVDSLVLGDAIQEVEPTKGGGVYDVHPRAPETFTIEYDDQGVITRYTQRTGQTLDKVVAILEPKDIVHIRLLKTTAKVYGDSLIGRALDDINRDVVVMEGATNAIKRHGFPKYHVRAGKDGDEPTAQAIIDQIVKEFQEMDSRTEWITNQYITISGLDQGTITGLESYNKVAVQRLCAALGVPGEILGFREGTTDNTAIARMEGFYKKIETIQDEVARTYSQQVVDRFTGKPGSVWIVFNPANQPSEDAMVAMLDKVVKWDPLNAEPYIRFAFDRLDWDYTAIEDAIAEAKVEVDKNPPPVANPMLDPAFLAQQQKMKDTAQVPQDANAE